MYKLTLDFPNLTKGAEVQIDGLGIFKNGEEHEIDDALAQDYRNHHSRVVDELDDDGEVIGRKMEQGPTLLQAFQDSAGVTVSTAASSKRQAKSATDAVDTKLPVNEGSVS